MKTSIKTIFATGLIALAISSTTVYANNSVNETSISASAVKISSINKLKISGNVEVTIIQNSKSSVLYTTEGNEDVLVKKVGSSIYVSSKNKNQAGKITMYVDDIYRIEATENASVLANDVLTLKYLQVYLSDNAYVHLNAKTENLYTIMSGSSKLDLKGSTDLYTIDMDKSSRISLDSFKSKQTEMKSSVYVANRY